MAKFTITIEDVTGGEHDGATDFEYRLYPAVSVDVDGNPAQRLTLAQQQGFALIGYFTETYRTVTPFKPIGDE